MRSCYDIAVEYIVTILIATVILVCFIGFANKVYVMGRDLEVLKEQVSIMEIRYEQKHKY